MFVRKKKNKSGRTSIQIIDKSSGKYKVIKTMGCTDDIFEIERYHKAGLQWIIDRNKQIEIDFLNERQIAEVFLNNIKQIKVIGTELLLGKIFDEIGFNRLNEELFRQLVFSRICFPVSKLKTTDYLFKYHSRKIDVDKIYRYLDKLNVEQKALVQEISYCHTLEVLNKEISIVFYDVTTLYFEIEDEDELRRTGFSKEGKHQNPQIVLGLLVSVDGYPLAYEIFEGNKFEGHTMLPIIDSFKKKFSLDKLVIIADSGLLSGDNISRLQAKGYEYILGGRIKNESQSIKRQILRLKLNNGGSAIIDKDKQTRIIISYSEARARKDRANREKGLKRLEKQIKSGKLTKSNINKRGYNKYLSLEGEARVSINRQAFEEDAQWDGLKGFITNTKLTKEEIIENYGHLWKIEKAFRISKTDLRIRPIYHRLRHRIEAHICISFAAYKVYKELERQLRLKRTNLSPEKTIEIAKTIYSIKVMTPLNKEFIDKMILLNNEQKNLIDIFNL
ncbi:MAG: transposase [Ignavibacteria bacterium]|nr:transposase [Ignavibacteria bacterium]